MVVCLAMSCRRAWAADALKEISQAEFQAEVVRLEGLAAACKAAAAGCDPKAVGDGERVKAEVGAPGFVMRWDWLRTAVDSAAKAKTGDREKEMDDAAGHLRELASQGAAGAPDSGFAKARAEATSVLARSEFQGAAQPSWWDRALAKFWSWVGRALNGIGALGKEAPWLGTALEVVFYLAAAVGILMLVQRALARQRLAISLAGGAAAANAWDKEAADWAALADQCAAQQEWREAVHCLYWAAIVRLEARRAWRHNPTRTPREYVRLLKPGSEQRSALGGLTQIFERVWYGLREASDEDYRQARGLFDGLGEGQAAVAATVANA
jgi:hypothetical protein